MNDAYWDTRYHVHGYAKTAGCHGDARHYVEAYADWSEIVAPYIGRGDAALDFGCGVGRWTPMLAGRYRVYRGVDVAEPAIDEARKRYGDIPGIEYNLRTIPAGPFDLIWTCTALQHVVDDDEFARILRVFADRNLSRVVMVENTSTDDAGRYSHIRKRTVEAYTTPLVARGWSVEHVERVPHPVESHTMIVLERT